MVAHELAPSSRTRAAVCAPVAFAGRAVCFDRSGTKDRFLICFAFRDDIGRGCLVRLAQEIVQLVCGLKFLLEFFTREVGAQMVHGLCEPVERP
jgi:hypothetical protein